MQMFRAEGPEIVGVRVLGGGAPRFGLFKFHGARVQVQAQSFCPLGLPCWNRVYRAPNVLLLLGPHVDRIPKGRAQALW